MYVVLIRLIQYASTCEYLVLDARNQVMVKDHRVSKLNTLIVNFIKRYHLVFFDIFLGFKQEGQACGLAWRPPTHDAGTCAPGLECKHFNPFEHLAYKHLHVDKPGICVKPGIMFLLNVFHIKSIFGIILFSIKIPFTLSLYL